MLHERIVLTVIPTQFAQVVAVGHVVLEQLGEARKAGVDRIAARVDEPRIGNKRWSRPTKK